MNKQVNVFCTGRTIIFHDEVNSNSVATAVFHLSELIKGDKNKKETEPINILLNSCGGYISDMWALVDLIDQSPTEIIISCTGYAYSAAFIIFLSGHKRYMSDHAILMYHELSSWKYGTLQDQREQMVHLENLNEMMKDYVLSHSGICADELEKVHREKRDWFIGYDDAVKMKLIDGGM